tara:strand:- start:345 stop:1562 length:1218 start_codon:yes stop_codon:yes gene_type:complete
VINNRLFASNNIPKKFLNKNYVKKFKKDFYKVIREVVDETSDSNKTLNILNDNYKFDLKNKNLNKFKKFKKIAIIGMGGSILGVEAIYNFLEKKIKKRVYFFDDLNPEKISDFKKKENLDKILFIIISKSGNTVETLSNFFSLNIIKKKSKNIILISEKKNNLLFSLSKKFNLFFIEHKKNIGGRYSVLSEVGIIPAYLMGVNIFKLRSNIKKFLKIKQKLFLKESSVKLASLLKSRKINNLVYLNYSPKIEKFLFWCQQLVAESLGKKGKGFFPTISNAPKDHHSLLQLYLDGPRDKLFYIFSLEEKSNDKLNIKKFSNKINFLHKKTLNKIKSVQKNALIKTLIINKIPYREFKIKNINEEIMGELFSYFMLETILIGKLAKINPYDQPAVEQVKTLTRKLLN